MENVIIYNGVDLVEIGPPMREEPAAGVNDAIIETPIPIKTTVADLLKRLSTDGFIKTNENDSESV